MGADLARTLQPLAQDLFDALWLEDVYGFRSHCRPAPAHGAMDIALGQRGEYLRWFGQPADGLRPLPIDTRPAEHIHNHRPAAETGGSSVPVARLAAVLEQAQWWQAAAGQLGTPFALACEQAAYAATQAPSILARLHAQPSALAHWEALSSLRDRPFHPLARAKPWSLTTQARERFGAEAGHPIALQWVAVAAGRWLASPLAAATAPAAHLLNAAQRSRLQRRARARGLHTRAYRWLPVHPWQRDYWEQAHGWDAAQVLDLDLQLGSGHATASLRTLAMHEHPRAHLKLSLSAPVLGAMRYLPLRSLRNGVRAQACLECVRQRDAWLVRHLHLCDERHWWALRQHEDVLHDRGELACLWRRYPRMGRAMLVPMAALPVTTADGRLPAFDILLGRDHGEAAIWQTFVRIAELTLELGLRCFRAGVMPELHGQNLLLAWRAGEPVAVVLRDHDSLRICAPLLREHGLAAPDYLIADDGRNTLSLETPAQLLAYLQTLLIEVNLHAVLAAIATQRGGSEAHGWRLLKEALSRVLGRVPLPVAYATQARELLLDAATWPFKQVLQPLLAQLQPADGMPSAMATLANPLRMTPRQETG